MNILKKLTIKNLKLNKKRTLVTIIGIILSVALLSAVTSMFFSCRNSLIAFEKVRDGNFHYAFYDVPKEELDTFNLNSKIEKYYLTKSLGLTKLAGIQNKYKPYVDVEMYDEGALNNLGIRLVKGRMPENMQEVLIPKHLLTNGKVELEVGDTLTLDLGQRVNLEGVPLNQYNPYGLEDEEGNLLNNEKIIDSQTYTFKIVGIMERPSDEIEDYSSPSYTLVTILPKQEENGTFTVYTRYNSKGLKNEYQTTAGILEVDADKFTKLYNGIKNTTQGEFDEIYNEITTKAKYDYNSNSYLITLETGITNDGMLNALATAGTIVIVIIIFTSAFCIKNSFDISVTERIKEYGELSSVGATKKQIRKSVYYEAFILGLIGIPLGILSGLFASYILLMISNYLLRDAFIEGLTLRFSFSILAILFAVILGIITILLSSFRSAFKASKIMPITAIRNSSDIKINPKKLKTPKFISKLFGVGGEISYKNLKRSKKKYRTTVISIVVCTSVFIALSSFINYAFKVVGLDYDSYNYNLEVHIYDENVEGVNDKIEEIKNIEDIKEIAVTDYASPKIVGLNEYYTKEYLNYVAKKNEVSVEIIGDEEDDADTYLFTYLVDDAYFKKYTKSLGLNYNNVKDKYILINNFYYLDSDENKYYEINKFNFKDNTNLTMYENDTSYDINIAKVTDKVPIFIGKKHFEVYLIGNAEAHQELADSTYYRNIYINSDKTAQVEKEIEDILKDYEYASNNIADTLKQMHSLFLLVAIFLYGFITVIALIGITNIFNTITTNMDLRKREFAILKSIGMTKKEFNYMVRLESLFYGLKSLLIGIPLGIILSYLIFKAINNGEYVMVYEIPYLAILIVCVVVFFLLDILMHYSLSKINKQNTIETIRCENI